MNTASTLGTAILRGFYNFICTGAASGITVYLALPHAVSADGMIDNSARIEVGVLTGILSGLAALGFRGGVEGQYDARRAQNVDQKSSDVGFVPPNPTP